MSGKITSISLLLFVISFCGNTASKKLRPPGPPVSLIDIQKLNECERCKILTDSFKYWLDKTSRGKYEGGDTAWEEANLKSYARSEVRLVEIQENLCSELKEHQTYCYTLSNEAEQVIEKWWFLVNPFVEDFHTWLCIENLNYCCPVHHFGDNCTPCPRDGNNNICSGHGLCDGDSTRLGNGTCNCDRGYTGELCEQCDKHFFLASGGSCEQCHEACNGCSGRGPTACHSCKPGWQKEFGVCVDVNECLSPSSCKSNDLCFNKEGSFLCKACDTSCKTCSGIGARNCTSCEPPNVFWGGMCISNTQHAGILYDMLKRLFLYIGLVIVVIHLFHTTRVNVGPVWLIFLGIIMYYFENTSTMNTVDVVLNMYANFNATDFFSDIIKTTAQKFNGGYNIF